jgi:hypothetical protein
MRPARHLVALLVALAACRPGSQPARPPVSEPVATAEPGPAVAPATAPPAAPPVARPASACDDPEAVLAQFGWVPAEARTFMSVQLLDDALTVSLATLVNSTPSRELFGTDFDAEFTDLRALLRAALLHPREAVYFLASAGVGVWAIPSGCRPDDFAAVAGALGFAVRVAPGPTPVTFAAGPPPNRLAMVRRADGSLWITGADQLGSLLAWIHGLSGEPWSDCELAIPPGQRTAPLRIFARAGGELRRHDITDTRVVTTDRTCSP